MEYCLWYWRGDVVRVLGFGCVHGYSGRTTKKEGKMSSKTSKRGTATASAHKIESNGWGNKPVAIVAMDNPGAITICDGGPGGLVAGCHSTSIASLRQYLSRLAATGKDGRVRIIREIEGLSPGNYDLRKFD